MEPTVSPLTQEELLCLTIVDNLNGFCAKEQADSAEFRGYLLIEHMR